MKYNLKETVHPKIDPQDPYNFLSSVEHKSHFYSNSVGNGDLSGPFKWPNVIIKVERLRLPSTGKHWKCMNMTVRKLHAELQN